MTEKNKLKYCNKRWEDEKKMQDSNIKSNPYKYYAESTRELKESVEVEPSVSAGGSLRFNKGKPEFSHLSPDFILELMKTMTSANSKYPYLNYTLKQDIRTASDSLMRHFLSFQNGDDIDAESGCHHLAHVAINAMIMFENLKDFGDEVDTRYSKEKSRVNNGS